MTKPDIPDVMLDRALRAVIALDLAAEQAETGTGTPHVTDEMIDAELAGADAGDREEARDGLRAILQAALGDTDMPAAFDWACRNTDCGHQIRVASVPVQLAANIVRLFGDAHHSMCYRTPFVK